MIQDNDEDILDQHDRMIQLKEDLRRAFGTWESRMIATNNRLVVTSESFVITPISKDINKGHATLMNVIVDRSAGLGVAFDRVFKSLLPYTVDYKISFE